MALLVAFFSASQDIVVDAYRTDLLEERERGLGTAIFVTGYRVGMIMSGAFAMIMSERLGWQNTYFMMAAAMGIGIAATLFSPEPRRTSDAPGSLKEAVTGPLKDFFGRPSAFSLLLFVIFYKLGDAYAGSMTTAFLIRGAGFSPAEVGAVNKGLGLISVILGATIGGTLMVRLGTFRALLSFGILQAVSILSFIPLVWTGKSYAVMVGAVAFENFTGGMGTAAFVALLMSLCNNRFSATQFALLSSIASLGRVFITPTSGFVAEYIGWGWFFVFAAMTALPGLLLLGYLRKDITQVKQAA
jgi:PAT family beta-lactamase induction signal transducer AmpG